MRYKMFFTRLHLEREKARGRAVCSPPDVEAVKGHILTQEVPDVLLILRQLRVRRLGIEIAENLDWGPVPWLLVGRSGAIRQTWTLFHNLKNDWEAE